MSVEARFNGQVVDFGQLASYFQLNPLCAEQIIVRDAVILQRDFRCAQGSVLGVRIRFMNCTFRGHVLLGGVVLNAGLELDDCVFEDDVAIRDMVINRWMRFDRCRFQSNLDVRSAKCPPDIRFQRTSFDGACHLELTSKPTGDSAADAKSVSLEIELSRILFELCRFATRTDLTIDSIHREVCFDTVEFEPSSITNIQIGKHLSLVSFPESHIAGRVKIRSAKVATSKDVVTWHWDARKANHPTSPQIAVSLVRTWVDGSLDVDSPYLHWVRLSDAAISAGSLRIPLEHLRLENEVSSQLNVTAVQRNPPPEEKYKELKNQYERLSNAFIGNATGQRHLDVCEFRARRFDILHRWHHIGAIHCTVSNAVLIGLVCLIVSMGLGLERYWVTGVTLGAAISLITAYLLYVTLSPTRQLKDSIEQVKLICALWVNQRMLGFGVKLRNVFISSGLIILLFGSHYGLGSGYFAENGELLDRCNRNVVTGNVGNDFKLSNDCHELNTPITKFDSIRIPLYFSVTRFMNLSTDEVRPTGRLQVVAAAETIIGIVMVTLIVALFGRRYLRL